jgi:hypothetical protein
MESKLVGEVDEDVGWDIVGREGASWRGESVYRYVIGLQFGHARTRKETRMGLRMDLNR